MQNYDLMVIGGGPGGYVAAIRAAQLGLHVALVEKQHLGGVCLNWGCIPTKALLRCAEVVSLLQHGAEYGFSIAQPQLDYTRAYTRSREVSAQLVSGLTGLMKKHKIDVLEGTGTLRGAHRVDVNGTPYQAASVILATGSSPAAPLGLSFDHPHILNPKAALSLTQLPSHIAILGAGAIGMEFATVWATYGVKISIVEMAPTILPLADSDVSALLQRKYTQQGMQLYTGAKVTAAQPTAAGVRLDMERDGQAITLEADRLLVAAGVRPNTAGLDTCGIDLNPRGYVQIDECMRTSLENVYAIGDMTGKLALAHVASAQGILAAEAIAGVLHCDANGTPLHPLDYNQMPSCVYTHPEVAQVGLTEAAAKAQGRDIKIGRFPFMANGRALAAGEGEGFVKLITDTATGELLGAHMVGGHVTEMVSGLAAWMHVEGTAEELTHVVHPHPSMSEAILEAAHACTGGAIHI